MHIKGYWQRANVIFQFEELLTSYVFHIFVFLLYSPEVSEQRDLRMLDYELAIPGNVFLPPL
jgi:hypothetical protein